MPHHNQFNVSDGNIEVLKTIPDMMRDETYRDKLRELVLEYITRNP